MTDHMGRTERSTSQRIEELEYALRWALSYITRCNEEPVGGDGELYEDYSGATRIAWPDDPEQWS